jgi:hypothetical protein
MKKITLITLFGLLCLFTAQYRVNAQAPAWLWASVAGGVSYDEAYTVAADPYGNSYAGGYYNTYIYNLPHAQSTDAFLTKYDPMGTVIWTEAISGDEAQRILCITFDKVGHYYILGTFDGNSFPLCDTVLNDPSSTVDIFLAKFNALDQCEWVRQVGGDDNDYPEGMAVDSLGYCYITGWFASSKLGFGTDSLTNTSSGFAEVFVAKYDPDGTLEWAKSAAGASGGTDKSYSVAIDKQGNCYIAGDFNSTNLIFDDITLHKLSNFSFFITKYAANGAVLWAKRADATGDAHGYAVAVDPEQNCYLAGSFWHNLTMGTTTLTSAGNSDIFLAKYAPDSTVLWAFSSGGQAEDAGSVLTTDQLGYCYMSGYFNSDTVKFDSWSLINNGSGFKDIFLTVCNPSGNIQWAKSIGGAHIDYPNSIAVDPTRNIVIAGYTSSPSITIGDSTYVNYGSGDVLVVKSANTPPSGIKGSIQKDYLSIYPNPAHDIIMLKVPRNSTIEIINIQGMVCKEVRSASSSVQISIEDLPAGIYIVKDIYDSGITCRKFIKN